MSYIRLLEFRLMLLSICKKISPQYGGIQPLLQVLRLYVLVLWSNQPFVMGLCGNSKGSNIFKE